MNGKPESRDELCRAFCDGIDTATLEYLLGNRTSWRNRLVHNIRLLAKQFIKEDLLIKRKKAKP